MTVTKRPPIEHYVRATKPEAPGIADRAYLNRCRTDTRDMIRLVDSGAWETSILAECFTAHFVELAQQATSFVDVGAERGFYAHLAAKHMPPNGEITCLEPDPVRAAVLREAFASCANIRVHQVAASDAAGRITMCKPGGCSATSADVAGERFDVEAVTLDDLLRGEPPDLLKLDIEGAEAAALKGAERILAHRHTTIFLEFHPWIDHITPDGRTILRDLFARNQYRMIRTDRNAPTETSLPGGRMIVMPPEE